MGVGSTQPVMLADWDLSKAIISDRDPKFLSELQRMWFKQLNVKLLTSCRKCRGRYQAAPNVDATGISGVSRSEGS